MAVPVSTLPPLESGDRLTADEFRHRYCARRDIQRAELVEGVVYVASPVSAFHGEPHGYIVTWLGVYKARHAEVRLEDNVTVRLDDKNEVQPDAFLWREEPGGPHLDAKGYLEGAPQLVFEIASSSASYDLHDKKEAYRRNGVQEYVVWRPRDGLVDWFRLVAGEYQWVEPDEDGVITSEAFPGLRLDIVKLQGGDLAGLLRALDY